MTEAELGRFREVMDASCNRLQVPSWGVCLLAELSRLLPGRHTEQIAGLAEAGGAAVVLLLPYYAGDFPGRNLSLHAVGDDYHRVAMGILADVIASLREAFPQGLFLPFVDSSPLPEVEAAVRAGLGLPGKNRQLITSEYGTRCFLCEVATDMRLVPTAPEPLSLAPDSCGDCTLCLRACPTGALGKDGIDTALCRSHITQKKGTLTGWEAEQVRLGGLVWGCDICVDCCPRNQHPAVTPVAALREHLEPVLTEEALDALLPEKSYGWRGRKTLSRNLKIIG